jgi:hypothetical protein
MKYASFLLILSWSIYTLVTEGNIRPSDNIILWILGVLSVFYSCVQAIIWIQQPNKK